MKPHRIRMTHNLLLNYGLYRKMEIYVGISRIVALLKEHNYYADLKSIFYFNRLHKQMHYLYNL